MKKTMYLMLMCTFGLVVTGCLTVGTMSVTILFDDQEGKTTLLIDYVDISSDEKAVEEIREDFDLLKEHLEGQEFVTDRAQAGLTILDRGLEIVDGKIVGHEKAVVKDNSFFTNEMKMTVTDTERRLIINSDDEEVIESNGTIVRHNQSTILVWPLSEKKIFYKVKFKDTPDNVTKNRPEMVRLVQEHLAKRKDQKQGHDRTKETHH